MEERLHISSSLGDTVELQSGEKENTEVDQSGDCIELKEDKRQSSNDKFEQETSYKSDTGEDCSLDLSKKASLDETVMAVDKPIDKCADEIDSCSGKPEAAQDVHKDAGLGDVSSYGNKQLMAEITEEMAEKGGRDSEVEPEILVTGDGSLTQNHIHDKSDGSPAAGDGCTQAQCKAAEVEVSSTEEPACDVTSTDLNNNRCASRAGSVATPDSDLRGISPEIFCMTHMSPTALYGKDHMIGAQRLLTRSHSSLSRSGSTLNTPDPVYIDNEDLEDIPYFHSKGVKRRNSELDENENPVPYFQTYKNLYQTNRIFPSQPTGPGQNSLYSSHRETKSHAACRLDFGSPADLSRPADYTSPVNIRNFDNASQPYASQTLPSFVSSHSFMPQNISRPLAVVPVMTSYPRYGCPQLDFNYNPCSSVPFSSVSYDSVFRSPFTPLYPQATSCSTNSFLRQTQASPFTGISHQSYVNLPNDSAYRHSPDSAILNRTGQNMSGNLNFKEIYRSTCQTNQDLNGNQALYTSNSYCQASRPEMNKKQDMSDLINNNLYGERSICTTNDAHRDAVATVTHEESNDLTYSDKEFENDEASKKKGLFADSTAKYAQNLNINTLREGSNVTKNVESAECLKDKDELDGEVSDSDSVDNRKTRNATIPVALKTKDKKMYVSVSDLGGKTVKQLLMEAKEKDSDTESRASTPTQYNEAFIERFKEEKKTKSPLSAFCAALEEPRKPPELRPILAAEPRIPIPALLMPNEVPMMYNGQMLVPYFQQGVTSSTTIPAMMPGAVHTIADALNPPPSLQAKTTQLGLLGSFTLTNKTSLALGNQLVGTPLNLTATGQESHLAAMPLNLTATGQGIPLVSTPLNLTATGQGSHFPATPLNLTATGQGSQLEATPLNLTATGQVQQARQFPLLASPVVTGTLSRNPHTTVGKTALTLTYINLNFIIDLPL